MARGEIYTMQLPLPDYELRPLAPAHRPVPIFIGLNPQPVERTEPQAATPHRRREPVRLRQKPATA